MLKKSGLRYRLKILCRQTKDKSYSCALKTLVSTNVCLDEEEFYFAVDSCPLAEEVVVLSAGLVDENLYRLMNLSRLSV
jgi:hypothetical protein